MAAAYSDFDNEEVKGKSLDEVEYIGINHSPIDLVLKHSGKRYNISDRAFLNVSKVFSNALEGEPNAPEIELDCRDDLMEFVVEYILLCKGTDIPEVPKPLSSSVMTEVLSRAPFSNKEPFEHRVFATYIDRIGDADKQQLYDLVMAANFLQMTGLLHLGLAKVCTWIKGFPIGQLKDKLLPLGPDGQPVKDFRPTFSWRPPTSSPVSTATVEESKNESKED